MASLGKRCSHAPYGQALNTRKLLNAPLSSANALLPLQCALTRHMHAVNVDASMHMQLGLHPHATMNIIIKAPSNIDVVLL
jgi:hypothetical protein